MSISAVGTATTPTAKALGLQDFVKILLTQLQYQDPLKPMDNQQFMAQMAQFTSLEQTQQLNAKIDTLIANQSALQSIGLIGRVVDFKSTDGSTLQGQVTSLSLAGASPAIQVTASGGTAVQVDLSQIIAVR